MLRVLATLSALLSAGLALAQHPAPTPGGGNLNPGLHTHRAAIEAWRDMKVGLSVHWGPSAFGAEEISWARGVQIPKSTYDSFYLRFDPVEFDAREWVGLAKRGGMRYVMPTSKHHDGFALWPSAVSPYDIAASPYEGDIVGELSRACRDSGLVFGTYYSIIDWYHPDYEPYDHGGPGALIEQPGDTVDFERYLAYMKHQLRELVVDYGARVFQMDGEWVDTWNHERGSDLYLYLRSLNDSVIVSSRVDVGRHHLDDDGRWRTEIYAGDYDERERMVDWVTDTETREFRVDTVPWQAWITIDKAQWAYNEDPVYWEVDSLLINLVEVVGAGGNYVLNLGPRPDGSFVEREVEIVEEVGAWLHDHEDAIYGTRGGPFVELGSYTSTVADDAVYLFVMDSSLDAVTIDPTRVPGLDVGSLTTYDGRAVQTASAGERGVRISVPAGDAAIKVMRLRRG